MLKRLCLFACLLVSSLNAQAPTWSLLGPAFSSSAAELETAASAIPAQPFAEVTVLFEQDHYAITLDGKVTLTHTLLYRIETKEGVEDWSSTAVDWDPWYQNQPTIRARVIQPGGRVSELDPKTLTDVPAKNEDQGTFSDARIHKGPLPSLAIGAIVETETTLTDKLSFFSAGNVYRVYFSRPDPVVRSRLLIESPAELPLRTKIHDLPESIAKTEQDGALRRILFDITSVPLEIDSDIHLATDKPRAAFVEFSTGDSWASVAAAYSKLSEPQIQPEKTQPLMLPIAEGFQTGRQSQ